MDAADVPIDPLNARDYAELKVTELKELLKARGLRAEKNLKMSMVQRLKEDDKRAELEAGIITIHIGTSAIKISKNATLHDLKDVYARQKGWETRHIRSFVHSQNGHYTRDEETLDNCGIRDEYVLAPNVKFLGRDY